MLAIIGTGSMGSAFAEGLLDAGEDVTVYNRTVERARPLKDKGARLAGSVVEALDDCDAVIVVLPDALATRAVLLDGETGAALKGKRVLNVAHTTAAEIIGLSDDVRERGGRLAEVNVTVYPDPVRTRAGHFVVASEAVDAQFWTQVLGLLGTHVHHVGEVGNASRAEFALWLSYMFNAVAVAYSAAAFNALDLPYAALVSNLTDNPSLQITDADTYLAQIRQREYSRDSFSVDNFAHSAQLVIAEASRLGLPTGPFEEVVKLYGAASNLGFGSDDVSSVFEVLARGLTPHASSDIPIIARHNE